MHNEIMFFIFTQFRYGSRNIAGLVEVLQGGAKLVFACSVLIAKYELLCMAGVAR